MTAPGTPLPQAPRYAAALKALRAALGDYQTTRTARVALDDLDRRWGQHYDLAAGARTWLARRLDDGASLTAASPEELHELIAADYAARPVTPARTQR